MFEDVEFALQFLFLMIVFTTSGSLILHVLFICPLKGIGLLLMKRCC
jgi:hypothetical protein